MRIARTLADLDRAIRAREPGTTVAFVPTMGALHDGHASLLRLARREAQELVASLFVNPRQFDDPADLAKYPRQADADARIAEAAGVDLLFVPSPAEMYPPDDATTIRAGGAALGFEGDHRPGHFDGVALVCLKLFNLVRPTIVYLGQKDAQQVAVLKQLVHDVNLVVEIRVGPTVRDADGLALSSRNVRLSPDERRRALAIPRALRAGLDAHRQGRDAAAAARAVLDGLDVGYVAVATFAGEPTLVIAATVGATRLIDNCPLDAPERAGMT
jgi:pantoate--beta-alanine ligase